MQIFHHTVGANTKIKFNKFFIIIIVILSSLLLNNLIAHISMYKEALSMLSILINYLLIFMLFITIISCFFDIKKSLKETISLTETKLKNDETAVRELLAELSDLAKGDLTVHASLKNDITKELAASINRTLFDLRKLVLAINNSATQISLAVERANAVSIETVKVSEIQASKIIEVTGSITEMAKSIEQVYSSASKSSAVATNSVGIASKGADVVGDMIMGMGQIRQQIQNTAIQIEKLGERSKEIGDMVSLIDDISDQTNILSLNAAIQAAMAGDAGRGFAVVADEIQRLAERTGHATQEIERIVRNIQTDTNNAVLSMEQTTTEVVHGAKLAEAAGVALEKIEEVSKELANLIADITNAALQQAQTSADISKSMDYIKNAALNASSSISNTALDIKTLSELITILRSYVAGFKINNQESS